MQRECKYCDNHQQVNMEKPEGSEKWIVTNLDGSFHKHVKYGGYQSQDSQQQIQHAPTTITENVQRAETANLRSEAIAKAHADNMDSNEQTRQTIRELTAELKAIGTSINLLNQTVKSYLSKDEEEERHPELDE